MQDLKDFLYLDSSKLHSFVSQIHGGLISEINETIKQLGGVSAGVSVGLVPIGGKIDASKGKESERQQTIQLTDPAYFNVLYQYLTKEKSIVDITALDLKMRDKLEIGQFVEFQCAAEPPVVEYWIVRVKELFGFLERNVKLLGKISKGKNPSSSQISNMELREYKAILDFMEDYMNLSRKDPGKQFIQGSSKNKNLKFWCGLLPDYINVSLSAVLPAYVQIFGRIERIMSEEEIYRIVDFSTFNESSDVNKLINALNGFSSFMGQKDIHENDLRAQYPDIFVSPIGIYR